ncbi:hypothetical protein F4818DRAFT_349911 [Hypoxylon cercidicola]|nr:hypothetical protein F4818DRAFT_349911 [Hypoxylon cercidicola]
MLLSCLLSSCTEAVEPHSLFEVSRGRGGVGRCIPTFIFLCRSHTITIVIVAINIGRENGKMGKGGLNPHIMYSPSLFLYC